MEKLFFIPEPRIFAHRGDSVHFPENTLPAFASAVEAGADVIETDVWRSKDGHFMVFHDDTLERLTDGTGMIGAWTLAELKRLDAGYGYSPDGRSFPFRGKGLTIPTLEETLEEFPQQRFNVDLKADEPQQADAYCSLIRRLNAGQRVLTASEHTGNLQAVRCRMPEMATSASHNEVAAVFFLYRAGLLFAKRKFAPDALQIPEFYRRWHVAAPGLIRRVKKGACASMSGPSTGRLICAGSYVRAPTALLPMIPACSAGFLTTPCRRASKQTKKRNRGVVACMAGQETSLP